MAKKKIPSLPQLLKGKIYKTGQTRGADDDVIFQNRVNRNGTVLIPYDVFDLTINELENNRKFENGFLVLINPVDYFWKENFQIEMTSKDLKLGKNALLFYETRQQWNEYNPISKNLKPANSRTEPLGGSFVARVPSTTSTKDKKISCGFNISKLKGAGIRVYEYASKEVIKDCKDQLEYLFWLCIDSEQVAHDSGMTKEQIKERKSYNTEVCKTKKLSDHSLLNANRMIDKEDNTVCPLCLEKLKGIGFLSRLIQAEGRNVPDLTVTVINLFHIRELRTGEFNHKPYNLGWGHHHCNVVCKDSGIIDTLKWMQTIVYKNIKEEINF
jgi:hypothetical protein